MTGDAAMTAHTIAAAVRSRRLSAHEITAAALDRIAWRDRKLNCFTLVRRDAALAEAVALDARIAGGEDPGPLAGVPFAAKNLFDVTGVTTVAGARIEAERAPATRDAAAVAALRRAGAILVGATNMDEYAYGFSTENTHYGATRNPHDPARVAGGSSGGSAAAVAAGLVPLALGTDTNGSIRVPAALCGIFGLKPTFGRLSRAGVFPLASSLDHVGPFARSVADLALAFDALQGPDATDPVCTDRPAEPCGPELHRGVAGLRLAVAGGHFAALATEGSLDAVSRVAAALGVTTQATLPEAHRPRAEHDDGGRGRGIHAVAPRRLHPAAVVHRPAGDLGPADNGGSVTARRSARRRAVPRVGALPRSREAGVGRRDRGSRRVSRPPDRSVLYFTGLASGRAGRRGLSPRY